MSINFRGISSQPAKPSVPVFHGSIDNSSAPMQQYRFCAYSEYGKNDSLCDKGECFGQKEKAEIAKKGRILPLYIAMQKKIYYRNFFTATG